MKQDIRTGLWYREETDDLLFLGKEDLFREHMPVYKHDIVMEIGANIGDTTRWLMERVKFVAAYEPIKSGAECIAMNAPKAITVNAGIGKELSTEKIYYKPTHYSSASRFLSSANNRYRIVNILPFYSELIVRNPTFIVMDCEGTEWDLLNNLDVLPSSVDGLAVEFHFHKYIKEYYKSKDIDIYRKITNTQKNGPEILEKLTKRFGPVYWKHGFAPHRNVSFAIWRKFKET